LTEYIGAPPAEKVIPATRGCDSAFAIRRTDDVGELVDFAPGTEVYMWIDIDKQSPTKVSAAVSGATATFRIESSVLDVVRNGTRWRAVLDVGDEETALLVGRFERHDG
jgi:hypothetical protein